MRFLEFSEDDGRETVLQHIAIIKAIEVQDRDGTEASMREHLTYLAGVAVRAPVGE
jgi:DNA-binding GntR family transcriptional regulator